MRFQSPLLQANIIYRIEKKILSGFPFYAFDFDMEAPPHDLPHFSFIVNGKPFTVKYADASCALSPPKYLTNARSDGTRSGCFPLTGLCTASGIRAVVPMGTVLWITVKSG